MNKANMETAGHLLMVPQTDRWSSAIINQSAETTLDVRLFESVTELTDRLGMFPNSLVVIELHPKLLDKPNGLNLLFERCTAAPLKIAVGGYETRNLYLQLIRAGFAEAFHSTEEVQRLLELSVKCLAKQPNNRLSIEEKVARDLPWAPISP